jgi:GWxTD domain-containing protein
MARGNTVTGRVERILQQTSIAPEVSMIRRIVLIALFVPLVGIATSTWITEARVLAPSVTRGMARKVVVLPVQQAPTPAPAPQPRAAQTPPAVESGNLLAKWPDNEVPDLISADERAVFDKLRTDDEREMFIEQFWLRRDPTPETAQNEFRDEYYRRIVEANQRFSGSVPGWKTDRGRIFVKYGPPDETETHSLGGTYIRDSNDGVKRTSTHPFERWRYRELPGLGTNIILEFVDKSENGDFKLESDPTAKARQ